MIHEASESWFDLGLELGLKPSTLTSIEARYCGTKLCCRYSDVRSCFRCVLLEWLNMTTPPPTWEALIAALKKDSVGLVNVANQVEEQCSVVECGIKSDSTSATSSATGIIY